MSQLGDTLKHLTDVKEKFGETKLQVLKVSYKLTCAYNGKLQRL